MTDKLYHYPLWLRIWHGVNALACLVLIVTGVTMQYANEQFMLMNFSTAVSFHNIAGIIMVVSYPVFLLGNRVTPNGRYYKMKPRQIWNDMVRQATYYSLGIFRGDKPPYPINENRKFNPLQKFTYAVTMYLLVPIVMVTGLALLFPEAIVDKAFGLSGTFLTAVLHSAIGFLISLFLLVHLYFATMGKTTTSNFKSIVHGYTETH